MKAERQKVRLNNKHPKEDASTFTLTWQRRRFPFFSRLHPIFLKKNFLTTSPPFLPLVSHLHLPALFSCALSCLLRPRLFISYPEGNSFRSRHFCLSPSLSKLQTASRRSGHTDVPGSIGGCDVSGVRLPACP